MNDLETKLKNILNKLKKSGISLQEANDLYFEAKKITEDSKEEEITDTKKIPILIGNGITQVYKIGVDFCQKWQAKKIEPTDLELNLLDKMANELLDVIPKLCGEEIIKEIAVLYKDFSAFVSDASKKLEFAKQLVRQEKISRIVSKGSADQQSKQIQKLQKEIESLTQQLFELQKQSTEMLELLKKNQDSNQPAKKQEIEQKLAQLQTKQQQVQSQLKEKNQTQQKILSNKDQAEPKEKESSSQTQTQTQPNPDKFN
jgi:hypothetical protein